MSKVNMSLEERIKCSVFLSDAAIRLSDAANQCPDKNTADAMAQLAGRYLANAHGLSDGNKPSE